MAFARLHAILGDKRNRSNINMPGINENVTNMLNKRHRLVGNKVGRSDPDAPQNVISTTAIMLSPPKHRDATAPESELYAPNSTNALADTPSRGDWAMTAPGAQDWFS